MTVGDPYVFPGFLTPVLTQLSFPKPPTTFPTCFCRGERQKYTGKKSHLNRGSYSQPPDHESDMLTTEPPGWGLFMFHIIVFFKVFSYIFGINSLSNDRNLDLSKLKAFADDKINVIEKLKF